MTTSLPALDRSLAELAINNQVYALTRRDDRFNFSAGMIGPGLAIKPTQIEPTR